MTRIEDVEMSVRLKNTLRALGAETLEDLTAVCGEDLLKIRNFGKRSLRELSEIMSDHGLALGSNFNDKTHEDVRSRIYIRMAGLTEGRVRLGDPALWATPRPRYGPERMPTPAAFVKLWSECKSREEVAEVLGIDRQTLGELANLLARFGHDLPVLPSSVVAKTVLVMTPRQDEIARRWRSGQSSTQIAVEMDDVVKGEPGAWHASCEVERQIIAMRRAGVDLPSHQSRIRGRSMEALRSIWDRLGVEADESLAKEVGTVKSTTLSWRISKEMGLNPRQALSRWRWRRRDWRV